MTLTLAPAGDDQADDLIYVPLHRLILSPLNARQTVDPEEIVAMSDSIAAIGLLQNLIGLQGDSTLIEIVAGGKRLRALQLLAKHGFMPRADSGLDLNRIPVRVTFSAADALEMAGAENAARTQPHPADEVRAYRAMAARDFGPRQIALAFAQTEGHVKRRLALAKLPDPILDALRADILTLDQAAAFTLAQSETEALAILKALQAPGAQSWNFHASEIRRKLTQDRPGAGDHRLAYVTLSAYTDAGGTLTLDLFQEHSYVNDAALLDRLATEKLEREGAALQQAEGWSFCHVVDHEHQLWGKVEALPRTEGELTEADADEYDRLSELAEGGALDDAGQALLDDLQARLDGDWTDDDRARAGIAVWIARDGTLDTRRAIILRDAPPAADDAAGDDDDSSTSTAPAPEAGLPQNLRDDLRAIRLLALQNALLTDGELLIDLLQWQASGGDMIPWGMPLSVKFDHSANTPAVTEGLTMPARLARPNPALDRIEPTPQAFAAFRDLPASDRMHGFFAAIARSFDKATGLLSVHLAQTLRPDARAIWTPNARNFFGRVPAAMLDAIWADLVPADRDSEHQTFASLNKKQKAAQLDKLFNLADYREALGLSRDQNARIDAWLPEDLRWPEADSADDAA